jgi:hypothetical protein
VFVCSFWWREGRVCLRTAIVWSFLAPWSVRVELEKQIGESSMDGSYVPIRVKLKEETGSRERFEMEHSYMNKK